MWRLLALAGFLLLAASLPLLAQRRAEATVQPGHGGFSGGGGFGGTRPPARVRWNALWFGFRDPFVFARIIFPRAPRLTGIQLARPESLAQL